MYSLHLLCPAEQVDSISLGLWEAGTLGIEEIAAGGNMVKLIAAFEAEKPTIPTRSAASRVSRYMGAGRRHGLGEMDGRVLAGPRHRSKAVSRGAMVQRADSKRTAAHHSQSRNGQRHRRAPVHPACPTSLGRNRGARLRGGRHWHWLRDTGDSRYPVGRSTRSRDRY